MAQNNATRSQDKSSKLLEQVRAVIQANNGA